MKADSSGSMRIWPNQTCGPNSALQSQIPRVYGEPDRRGTEESNLALRFWRPPCYRYTSPPRAGDSRRSSGTARTVIAGSAQSPPSSTRTRSAPVPSLGQLLATVAIGAAAAGGSGWPNARAARVGSRCRWARPARRGARPPRLGGAAEKDAAQAGISRDTWMPPPVAEDRLRGIRGCQQRADR
jgi:hypothetical protein